MRVCLVWMAMICTSTFLRGAGVDLLEERESRCIYMAPESLILEEGTTWNIEDEDVLFRAGEMIHITPTDGEAFAVLKGETQTTEGEFGESISIEKIQLNDTHKMDVRVEVCESDGSPYFDSTINTIWMTTEMKEIIFGVVFEETTLPKKLNLSASRLSGDSENEMAILFHEDEVLAFAIPLATFDEGVDAKFTHFENETIYFDNGFQYSFGEARDRDLSSMSSTMGEIEFSNRVESYNPVEQALSFTLGEGQFTSKISYDEEKYMFLTVRPNEQTASSQPMDITISMDKSLINLLGMGKFIEGKTYRIHKVSFNFLELWERLELDLEEATEEYLKLAQEYPTYLFRCLD